MFHTIPVVMLSGTKTSQNRIACLKEGAEDFIVKPFNPTELAIKVANLIKRNSLQSA
jgi:DNA-binding response OmpR family regulator